jgi:hypothetical protein
VRCTPQDRLPLEQVVVVALAMVEQALAMAVGYLWDWAMEPRVLGHWGPIRLLSPDLLPRRFDLSCPYSVSD